MEAREEHTENPTTEWTTPSRKIKRYYMAVAVLCIAFTGLIIFIAMRNHPEYGLSPLILGGSLAIVGVSWSLLKGKRLCFLFRFGIPVTATVVRIVQSRRNAPGFTEIEFDVDNITYRKQFKYLKEPKGCELEIMVNPNNHNDFTFKKVFELGNV